MKNDLKERVNDLVNRKETPIIEDVILENDVRNWLFSHKNWKNYVYEKLKKKTNEDELKGTDISEESIEIKFGNTGIIIGAEIDDKFLNTNEIKFEDIEKALQ